MNRTELLELCFNKPEEELPVPREWLLFREQDETNPNIWHVRSIVGIGQKRVLVRNSISPGDEILSATTTIAVAAIMNVCTDPDFRGRGFATRQMEAAHETVRAWALTNYAALFAGPSEQPFYERLGYVHPSLSPEAFMVKALRDEPWPDGQVMIRETW